MDIAIEVQYKLGFPTIFIAKWIADKPQNIHITPP
jgi:hypothetical protein